MYIVSKMYDFHNPCTVRISQAPPPKTIKSLWVNYSDPPHTQIRIVQGFWKMEWTKNGHKCITVKLVVISCMIRLLNNAYVILYWMHTYTPLQIIASISGGNMYYTYHYSTCQIWCIAKVKYEQDFLNCLWQWFRANIRAITKGQNNVNVDLSGDLNHLFWTFTNTNTVARWWGWWYSWQTDPPHPVMALRLLDTYTSKIAKICIF